MCYSAQIEADYRAYVKLFGADIDIKAFVELYWYRRNETRLKLPKGMERAFADPHTDDERRVKQLKAAATVRQQFDPLDWRRRPEAVHCGAWRSRRPSLA